MLTRRILRIKTFKTLYAYAEDPSMTLKEAEISLRDSIEATRDLYLFMTALAVDIVAEASRQIQLRRSKLNPTEEDLNPNLKFVSNLYTPILENDPDLAKLLSRKKLSWQQYDIFIRNILDSIRQKKYYKDYMSTPGNSLKEDAELFKKIYAEEFEDNTELEKILEDISILWTDDLGYVLSFIINDIESTIRRRRWEYPPLFNSDLLAARGRKADSDFDFVHKLLHVSFGAYKDNFDKIAASAEGWESDRLFATDIVLIDMGLAEAAAFPEIPLRATINEYVEISKYYGAPKSRVFVNGLLDKLLKKEIELGNINKTI